MKSNHFQIHKNFFSKADLLRKDFENLFNNPRSTEQKRFVWDYWYFENQYHLLRTPAYYYFNEKVYSDFHNYLVQWGRENLGCHDISPTWLSYYVDGCYQNLHSDVPHGPWAFVFSLTIDPKKFLGGETLILKPEVLNYWNHFSDSNDYELNSFVDRIPSNFNQLVVFDPRFPHGVTEVKGTRDPLKARLVIHGWFVQPRPYVVGGLKTNQVEKPIKNLLLNLDHPAIQNVMGTLSIRLNVKKSGEVDTLTILTNTLVHIQSNPVELKKLIIFLKSEFIKIKFSKSTKASSIVIPIIFR